MSKATTNAISDGVSVKNAPAAKKDTATTVRVFLPLLEDTGTDTKVDQTETVLVNGIVTQIRGRQGSGFPAAEEQVPESVKQEERYESG